MAFTIDVRKEEYYNLVIKKGEALYSNWEEFGMTAKKIVAKTHEYVFDKRLKTDAVFRLQVIVFAYALKLRLEKRYGTFWRKLFRFFAYLRERNALKILKRLFGFFGYTDIREIIRTEIERVALILSRRDTQDTTGGGKRAGMGELSVEEELQQFFDESVLDETETNAERDLSSDKADDLENKSEPFSIKPENGEREKISIYETNESKEQKDGTKEVKNENQKKEQSVQNQTELSEAKREENPAEKSVANTSILAEMIVAEQTNEKEPPSPFPVFREESEDKSIVEKKSESVESKEQSETTSVEEKEEIVDKNAFEDAERQKSPFPVFNRGNNIVETPIEVPTENLSEQSNERETVASGEDLLDSLKENQLEKFGQKTDEKELKGQYNKLVLAMENISEENMTRIILNMTMSDEQIAAIAQQVKDGAKMVMKEEESAWREQISVEQEVNANQTQTKSVVSEQNNESVIQTRKK